MCALKDNVSGASSSWDDDLSISDPKRIKMKKYLPTIILIFYCNLSFAEQLLNQDVDISSGSTLSNDSGLTIRELSGGPYTIDNRGTIEATNITSSLQNIRLRVGTSVDNSGLIDTSGSAD